MADRLERESDDEYEPGNNIYADNDDDFNFEGLYANLSISTQINNNNPPPPPAVPSHAIQPLAQLMTREEEDQKISEFVRKSVADWQRYLRTGVRRGRGRGRGRGADYHERKPPAGYVCHRCGATEEHYIYNCPTNGDPAFDNFANTSRRERNVFPPRTNIASQPDEEAFERAIQGIPTLQSNSAEVIAASPFTQVVVPASTSTFSSTQVVVPASTSASPSTLIVLPASTSPAQDAFDQPVRQFEETQQQNQTGNYVQTNVNVSAGRRQNGFIRNKPYPGYVCHRCLTPDDHYIHNCPTNGDPAYDNYIRPPAKSFNARPFVPTPNYGVTTSAVPIQTRPLFNYNVAQGYPNPAQGYPNPAQVFPPVQFFPGQGTQGRGNASIHNNSYSRGRTHRPNNTLRPDQRRNVNDMQRERPNQHLHQVPRGNQSDREGVDEHESGTEQFRRRHGGNGSDS